MMACRIAVSGCSRRCLRTVDSRAISVAWMLLGEPMPESRLSKARETLPLGYQFGDAGEWARVRCFSIDFSYEQLVAECDCPLCLKVDLAPAAPVSDTRATV